MSERDGYEPGVPCWVATIQDDATAAAAFYGGLFGWESERGGSDENPFFVARLRGRDVAGIGSTGAVDPAPPPMWITHVRVERADEAVEVARAAGATILAEAFDAPPAGRLAVLTDPTGALVNLWEPRDREGCQLVNEPGAWAMSRLDTPEPEKAAAFYAEVFGWTTERFAAGAAEVWLFRLPGYVGGEPEQPVSREVVAAMARTPAGTPAAWSVDFWVDDVDAAAVRAGELGGAVPGAPADGPVGRSAQLTDPWGARFSVSQVSPPR